MSTRGGPGPVVDFRVARELLVAESPLGGGEFRRALAGLCDAWVAELFDAAAAETELGCTDLALVALGGYGRGELWPGSDLDLAVIHRGRPGDAARIAEAVWYPVWDAGLRLGHGVRGVADAVATVGSDLASATSLLDARRLAGDADVVAELSSGMRAAWAGSLPWVAGGLRADAAQRRARSGDVAFLVEPDLKVGGGGLRDARIPGWLAVGGAGLDAADAAALDAAATWLADVRLALHRVAPGVGDVLRLEDQDAVAAALGCVDADELMTRVARAARRIDWLVAVLFDGVGTAIGGPGHPGDPTTESGADWDVGDPVALLTRLAAVARSGGRLDRRLLGRLASQMPAPPEPWDAATRQAFVALLGAGPGMIGVVEALDQVGVWERLVPEWHLVRSRAQRTTHHRFTVDRHLLETVAIAAGFTDRVSRPDLLLVAALAHDLGKGQGADHSVAGVATVERLAPRLGFDPVDTATLGDLVRHHLLLPEVATRRDIGDAATIDSVAATVASLEFLGLLAALTEADARATGPTAWTDWKAGLVRTLVERVGATLTGTDAGSFRGAFPSPAQRRLAESGVTSVHGTERTLTVVTPDRPGVFWRVAGALVLSGLNVVSAEATVVDGMALEVFAVAPAFAHGELEDRVVIDWPRVGALVEAALAGRVAVAARVAARATTYRRRPRGADTGVRIRFDDLGGPATGRASIIEVDAPDHLGVLFAITHALAELDVDIGYARVETRSERVVDAFSITCRSGASVADPEFRAELERAVRHGLAAA